MKCFFNDLIDPSQNGRYLRLHTIREYRKFEDLFKNVLTANTYCNIIIGELVTK